MSQYFTSTGIFTNNHNICYHSEIMPASIYLEEVRIFSIHKILSPPGVWKTHNNTLLMGFSVISLWLPWLGMAISWTSHVTWKILIVRNTRCFRCFLRLNYFIRKWILASSLPHKRIQGTVQVYTCSWVVLGFTYLFIIWLPLPIREEY